MAFEADIPAALLDSILSLSSIPGEDINGDENRLNKSIAPSRLREDLAPA
jgi:hypothetical protein